MNQRVEKPSLQGQRLKTRKRDEKEKYDPYTFRDAVVEGVNAAGADLDAVSKFLDSAGSKLNYRRYAEPMFDVLIAGSILAPGGHPLVEPDKNKITKAEVSVFTAENNYESLKRHAQVFHKLIRRYKYLEHAFRDEMNKILTFLKGFGEEERSKLATITGIFLATGVVQVHVLHSLLQEHLVKEGIAVQFACEVFSAWLKENKDCASVTSALRKAGLDSKLELLLPINKRSTENLHKHFADFGLAGLIDYQKAQRNTGVKKELQSEVSNMINDEIPVKEIVAHIREQMKKHVLPEHEVVILIWSSVMSVGEWNKKEELVADQALKHLRQFVPIFSVLTTSSKSEITLISRIQEYCYDNMNFMKSFQKIVILFYKMDVLSEDSILRWYKESHSAKGKTIFLEQMKKFIDWLQSAEEESESENENEDENDKEDDE